MGAGQLEVGHGGEHHLGDGKEEVEPEGHHCWRSWHEYCVYGLESESKYDGQQRTDEPVYRGEFKEHWHWNEHR